MWAQFLVREGSTLLLLTAAKSLQSCPTLCDPIHGSPPGSAIPGILQARTLKWVAISFSNASKWKVKVKSLSRARLFAIPWTAAYQSPPSMGFSRQEYWSGVPLPSPFHISWGQLSMRPTKPESHKYWACMLELLKPASLEPVLHNKKGTTMRNLHALMKSSPCLPQLEKTCT